MDVLPVLLFFAASVAFMSGEIMKLNAEQRPQHHPVARLSCADHGGPADRKSVDEMVYWSDLPGDASYLSPMHDAGEERFLTFEPERAGWNNNRMAMETASVIAHATGRTLVLPPRQPIYSLNRGRRGRENYLSFEDFFHLGSVSDEHGRGFRVITMDEFLDRVARTGGLGRPPPEDAYDRRSLFLYLREVGTTPPWYPERCILAIPATKDERSIDDLNSTFRSIVGDGCDGDDYYSCADGLSNATTTTTTNRPGRPTPVNSSMVERMREILAGRRRLCAYDRSLQGSKLIHLAVSSASGARLITHFYAFVFFADWRQDLWSKRFVRDHFRYVDEIVCAAAR